MAEYRLGDLDDCLGDCDIAIKRAPKFSGTYIYRGHVKADKGDLKGALLDCEKYLQMEPTDQQALNFERRLTSE